MRVFHVEAPEHALRVKLLQLGAISEDDPAFASDDVTALQAALQLWLDYWLSST